MRTEDITRKLQALWCRCTRWMNGTLMVAPIIVLATFFSIYTTLGTGIEAGQIIHRDLQVPYAFSDVVKNMPDQWDAKTWDDYENGLISAYERDIRLGRSEKLRPIADSLSERIWQEGKDAFMEEGVVFAVQQTAQHFIGKYSGKLLTGINGELAPEVAEKLAEKLTPEVSAQLSKKTLEAVHLYKFGKEFGKAVYAVGVSKVQDVAPERKKGPDLTQEVLELVEGMRQAIQAEPQQVLVARLHHIIHYHKNDSRRLTREQTIEDIKKDIEFRKLGELTQEGNKEGSSPDSIWKDKDEMARWILLQVEMTEPGIERELEEKPDEEPEEEPKEPPIEVEPEPEDIPLPMPFFTKSDAEKLAPSSVPTTYAAGKRLGLVKIDPSVEWWYGDGVQDTIMYDGRWGTRRTSSVSVGVWCFEDAGKVQKFFRDELLPEARTDAALKDNERSKYGCTVIPDSFQESSDRITYQVPYCRQRDPQFFYEDEGEIIVYQIYRNTIIVIDGLFFDPDYEAQVRQIISDMEKNAMLVVDTAIERAKSQGWRE